MKSFNILKIDQVFSRPDNPPNGSFVALHYVVIIRWLIQYMYPPHNSKMSRYINEDMPPPMQFNSINPFSELEYKSEVLCSDPDEGIKKAIKAFFVLNQSDFKVNIYDSNSLEIEPGALHAVDDLVLPEPYRTYFRDLFLKKGWVITPYK